MNRNEFDNNIWRYYLLLENDFLNTLKYATLSDENQNVFSVEYSKQLLSIGSEIDVISKLLFELSDRSNMDDYKENYVANGFQNIRIGCLVNRYEYTPFVFNNATEDGYTWWKAYNLVKHDRTNNYKLGNQVNTFTSLQALYVLVTKLYEKHFSEGEPEPSSQVFYFVGKPIIKSIDERGDWATVQTEHSLAFIVTKKQNQ